MRTLIHSITVALLLLASATASAATYYGIEVIIFSRDSSMTDELWPAPQQTPASGFSLTDSGYRERSPASFFLKSTSRRIENAAGHRILYHGSWSQPVLKSRNSKPVAIRAGSVMPDGFYEVEGAITVDRGRYLHFKPNLQLRRNVVMADGSTQMITTTLDLPRRMRSKEAHYIDHPLFGMVVYAVPLN
ncbi:CsiV family protein [Neptunomonas sp. XY-337]|uniref:CsiV family protein n=1 Tax=Neptunomonas sp. XY-337 TaxID=2561897 RepID=UPI0010AB27FC|nr:CsiV family protein [Neptunomonas sp. XY-337]